jgi:ATP-dependent exoDNAse (exonuclease V) beta subunit
MLLQRNLLYTALTRARKKVVVVGQESAIESAISNASIKNRNTAFAKRVISCLEAPVGSAALFTAPFHKIPESAENYHLVQKLLNPSKPEKTWALESDDYID